MITKHSEHSGQCGRTNRKEKENKMKVFPSLSFGAECNVLSTWNNKYTTNNTKGTARAIVKRS